MSISQENTLVNKVNCDKPRNNLWIPRRRVFALVQLADNSDLQGDLYADICGPDGNPGRVADRLNDLSETFMPIAIEDRHILLNKRLIVSVSLSDANCEIGSSRTKGLPKAGVVFQMSTGKCLEGSIYASSPSASRMLDQLNDMNQRFIPLESYGGITWVNIEYLVGLSEIADAK